MPATGARRMERVCSLKESLETFLFNGFVLQLFAEFIGLYEIKLYFCVLKDNML